MLCLHRENASHGFEALEVDLIRRISPHVAEGLRRAIIVGPAEPVGAEATSPGIIVLDAGLNVVSMSPEAGQWLAEIDGTGWPHSRELPLAVYAAAARLTRPEDDPAHRPRD